MRYVTAVAAAVAALLGSACGNGADDHAGSMPDRAAAGDLTDLWVGLARTHTLDEAVALAVSDLALLGVVVVYPWDDGTVMKATVPLSSEESPDAVRAAVQLQLRRSFQPETRPSAQTSLHRMEQGDIPVGAVRLVGSTDNLVRFVTAHRCEVHSLQVGTFGGQPILSREVDPS